ncbi:MAG TPA: methyltransferase [Tepidisphaeraceae bacterium]
MSKLAEARCRLLQRIERKYATRTQTHAIGPLRLKFTRIADADVVLDQIVEEEDRREKITGQRRDGNELHLPYWAELWDSAIGIAVYLSSGNLRFANCDLRSGNAAFNRKSQFANRKCILDLGCGMGFAGMAAAALGAKVLFADLEPDALLFARLNTLPWANRVRTRQLNWQSDRLDESFDLILGADVLYDRTQWEFLDAFFRAHLREDGCVLLGEPGRQTGEMFPEWITQRGWALTHISQKIPTRKNPIRIFRLSHSAKK